MKKTNLSSIRELLNVIDESNEIILYGAGRTTELVASYLGLIDYTKKVICSIVSDSEYRVGTPFVVGNLPVLRFSCVRHFSDTALFLVSTNKSYQDEIIRNLEKENVNAIAVITDELIALLDEEMKLSFDQIIVSQLQSIMERIETIEWKIEEQNEVCSVNSCFYPYRDKYYGKDVVVLGTGPTFEKYTPIENAIHIGVNNAWKRNDIKLDYFFIQDGNRKILNKITDELKNAQIDCPIFVGQYLKRTNCNTIEFPEEYSFFNELTSRYVVGFETNGRERGQSIYKDICFHPLMDFQSVIFPAIHFALYTYPKRLYLVGCDIIGGNQDEEMKRNWKLGYAKVKMFAEMYYPKTTIISVNPRGLKGLFVDEYFD